MKAATKTLLETIDKSHDWNLGTTRFGKGTQLLTTDCCRICSLRRLEVSDERFAGESDYRFSDGETGKEISLRHAAMRGCHETKGASHD